MSCLLDHIMFIIFIPLFYQYPVVILIHKSSFIFRKFLLSVVVCYGTKNYMFCFKDIKICS